MTERQWGSKSDPRRFAAAYDARNNALRPVGNAFNAFYAQMPEDVRRRIMTDRAIRRTHDQFAQVVDPFILKHTNSVYLTRNKDTQRYDLVVYLDNSTCAAELNARRELIRLKYRELFGVTIDVFEIRISRGAYKDKHPFAPKEESSPAPNAPCEPTAADIAERERALSAMEEGPLKESLRRTFDALRRKRSE